MTKRTQQAKAVGRRDDNFTGSGSRDSKGGAPAKTEWGVRAEADVGKRRWEAVSGKRQLIVPFLAGVLVGGGAVLGTLVLRADKPSQDQSWAPPPQWTDAALGCQRVKELEGSYGQSPPGALPFSEVSWLNSLVDATEIAGATQLPYMGGDANRPEWKLAFAASNLRTVTIGGGLNHPEFPRVLVEFTDRCDRYL